MGQHSSGPDGATPATYFVGRWLFLRLLGVVYLIAFLSLWVQIEGLVGSAGILPLGDYLDWIRQHAGADRFLQAPTLLWIGHSDGMLDALCGAGVLLAFLLVAGVATIPALFLLWAVYLSLVIGGQTFLSFQWDVLLLEAGFCALFLAPATLRPRPPWLEPAPSAAGLWLLRLLLFKLLFLSGIVKLISLDRTWWELTALDYHYFTQPLPTWTSWYAHQLPGWFQKLSILLMYVIEIAVPFLIFFSRLWRRLACVALVFLQLLIAFTGNYGFFNLLTVVLCVLLLDDALLLRLVPRRWRPASAPRPGVGMWQGLVASRDPRRLARALPTLMVLTLIGVSGLTFVREMVRTEPAEGIGGIVGALFRGADRYVLSWGQPYVLRWTRPFRTINGYGLFRGMTTARPEIVFEGSLDGRTWMAYEFKWKPGAVTRRPVFIAPHQPRLDWQMWFAALSPRRAAPWLQGLTLRLLEGSPEVLELLGGNPFPDRPPRYVRAIAYRYQFTTPGEKRKDGAWWSRKRVRVLLGPVSLSDF